MFGVWVVDDVWRNSIGRELLLLPIAFFSWLAIFGLFQVLKSYEHKKHPTEEMDDQLFGETAHVQPQDAGANDEEVEVVPNETNTSANRRQYMHKDSTNATGHGYYYHTGKNAQGLFDKFLLLYKFVSLFGSLTHSLFRTCKLILTGCRK